jgi:septal ring factor EnvC (AmiA/AmiB activator)
MRYFLVVDNEIGKIRPQHDHETRLLKNEEKDLKAKEIQLSKTQSDKDIEKNLQEAQKQVEELKRQLIRQHIVPEEIAGIDASLNEASNRLTVVERERRRLLGEYHWLDFSYR